MSFSARIDSLDPSIFDAIGIGGTSGEDRQSLLALHSALGARGDFAYLEVGSYLGASLQSFIVDPRCSRIVSIDRRDATSPDRRGEVTYPDNTTAEMLERLSRVPGANLDKLTTVDSSTDELDPSTFSADLCFIDAEHTDDAALRDARFCRRVLRERGVIVFHDRKLVTSGILRFLGEAGRSRSYPLAHDLFVIEFSVPTLLADARVQSQLPRKAWLAIDRLRAIRPVLWATSRVTR